ncbi:hypothetical protein MMC26_006719 [Xylographa opegraphella]|nr:hypothetical protein [Xylographa opegraphella]
MKRKATDASGAVKSKRPRESIADYCDVEPRRDVRDGIIWPAPEEAMDAARAFLRKCAAAQQRTLIVPDKDADGLDAGVIVHRTLTALGLSPALIDVHLVKKGANIHDEQERASMQAKDPKFVVVVDQGSRSGPPVVADEGAQSLIIDHHLSDDFPQHATVVSACHYPPVATSALLTYEICKPLHADVASKCGYLCAMGTHGDLGTTLKWKPPFPDMADTFRAHSKKAINDAVSLINAPRRTATFDVRSAWDALLHAPDPKALLAHPRLLAARAEINAEVERHTHAPPKFSRDGRIAVLRIHSTAQVHPVIATRWAGHLASKALEIVIVANAGYMPGMVNFSCRIARCARARDPPVDIIAALKAVADLDATGLAQRLGDSFARGHKEASGGIVPAAAFEELMALMKVGEKPDAAPAEAAKGGRKGTASQKNNLMNYFRKGAS